MPLQGHVARTATHSSGRSGTYLPVSHALKYLFVLGSLTTATMNSPPVLKGLTTIALTLFLHVNWTSLYRKNC